MRERSCLLFVCNVEFILSRRWMVENESTFMKLLQVELEGLQLGIKEGHQNGVKH